MPSVAVLGTCLEAELGFCGKLAGGALRVLEVNTLEPWLKTLTPPGSLAQQGIAAD